MKKSEIKYTMKPGETYERFNKGAVLIFPENVDNNCFDKFLIKRVGIPFIRQPTISNGKYFYCIFQVDASLNYRSKEKHTEYYPYLILKQFDIDMTRIANTMCEKYRYREYCTDVYNMNQSRIQFTLDQSWRPIMPRFGEQEVSNPELSEHLVEYMTGKSDQYPFHLKLDPCNNNNSNNANNLAGGKNIKEFKGMRYLTWLGPGQYSLGNEGKASLRTLYIVLRMKVMSYEDKPPVQ